MGIFSGLSGAFLAGATERVSANWKENREKMEAKIAKKTQLFYDDAKTARDARRAEKKTVKQQFEDALAVLGNDPNAGAVAEAMARLTPEQFAETKATLIKVRAEADVKGTGTDLRSLGYIGTDPEATKASEQAAGLGITMPQAQTEKFTGSSDDAVKRIMGTFEGTKVGVDPKENKTLQQGFLKHIGGLSTGAITSEAQREAAEQLGVSPEELRALTSPGDAFTTGIAPRIAGVSLGAVDPSVRMGMQKDALGLDVQRGQLDVQAGTLEAQNLRRQVDEITLEEAQKNQEIITIGDQTGTMDDIIKREGVLAQQVLRKQAEIGSKMTATDRNVLSNAVLGFTEVLEPNGVAFTTTQNNGRVYLPAGDRAAQGALAINLANILRSRALDNVRMRPGDSIDDGRMDGPEDQQFQGANYYLETKNSMIEILEDINKDGTDNYSSPFKAALDEAELKTPGVGRNMLAKIREAAGFGEATPNNNMEQSTWDGTSGIDNMDTRVRTAVEESFDQLGLTDEIITDANADSFYSLVNIALRASGGEYNPESISNAVRTALAQIE